MTTKPTMKIEWRNIEDVIPYPGNPRVNDAAVDRVASSIEQFGWQQPIVVDKSGTIIVGHTRLKAGQKLNAKFVPVYVSDISEEAAKVYRIADNKTGDVAEWDWEKLSIELHSLEELGVDLTGTAFTEAELANLLAADWRPPPVGDLPDRAGGQHQVHFSSDQWLVVEQAVAKCRGVADGTISQARAIELICADYVAGA